LHETEHPRDHPPRRVLRRPGHPLGTARAVAILTLAGVAVAACGPSADQSGVTRVGDDLVGARGELQVVDSVPGDVMLAGGRIEFRGSAGGDYLGAGGEQAIDGRIGGDVRAAGGRIVLGASVTRNATVAGGEVELRDDAVVDGTAYLAGGSVRVGGTIRGALRVGGGDVTLNGPVGGDVLVEAGVLRIGPAASIGGDLTYRLDDDEEPVVDAGARIAGRTLALPPRPDSPIPGLIRMILLLGFLVAGAALVLLFPDATASAADTLRQRPGMSLGLGVVWVLAVPLATFLIAFTVIGLPLAMIAGFVYLVSLYLGRTVTAVWIGWLVLRGRRKSGRAGALLAFLLGGVLLVLAQLVPYVGTLVLIAATLLGLGAFVLSVWTPAEPPA